MAVSDPFILFFDELPDDLIADNIDDMITYRFQNSEYEPE
jgi:hypothetical protein